MTDLLQLIWIQIVKCQGFEIYKKNGDPFTYTVSGNILRTSCADQDLHRSNFEKAWPLMPGLSGPGQLSQLVRGPAYVWAILADRRIAGPAVKAYIEACTDSQRPLGQRGVDHAA